MSNTLNRIVFALLIVLGTAGIVAADTSTASAGGVRKIAVAMSSLRRKTVKYVYKDLNVGLRRQNVAAQIEILPYGALSDQLFKTHDVVIVVSERQRDSLDPAIVPFVSKHTANPQLITVSFLPGGRGTLASVPRGVDALTSPSREKPAQRFVIGPLSEEVKRRVAVGASRAG